MDAYEAMPNLEWPANIRNLTLRTSGPLEVNFNYYPTWEGNDRIVGMTFARAYDAGVDFVGASLPLTGPGTPGERDRAKPVSSAGAGRISRTPGR